MSASILATLPALQEIPRCKDKSPIFVEIVVNIFDWRIACGVIPADPGRGFLGSNRFEIRGYFLSDRGFKARAAPTLLAEVKRHDQRIVSTPTRFILTLQPTGEQHTTG
jgi:hypothetical protein